jgi:polysaccharide deacetylase family protein (PEP-CTERM system associated)
MQLLPVRNNLNLIWHETPEYVRNITSSLRKENDLYRSRPVAMTTGTKGIESMKPALIVTAIKRTLDITAGLVGSSVFVLAYPILALLIKLESPGPILYLQSRVGIDKRSRRDGEGSQDPRRIKDVGGAVFTLGKFRSMRMDAESNGPQLCSKSGDPRVTRLGKFLRSTHLDELPQFWNVLKGEMSFIGPRPERPHFTVKYFQEIPAYRERTRMLKPGITGLSQITLGYDDSLESVMRKTHFDLIYRSSLSNFRAWFRMEAWVVVNTLRYLLNRAPLKENASLKALVSMPSLPPLPKLPGQREPAPHTVSVMASHDRSIKTKSPLVQNFLTIDVECWFHAHNLAIPKTEWEKSSTRVVDNVQTILNLLAARQTKATFFVLGWVADRFPEVVKMIAAGGHEIGTHGYFHDKITDLSPYQFEKDLEMSLNSLARLTSQKIVGHRASNFSIVSSTLWALEILARHGLEYDSSIFPIARKRYGIADYPNRMPHIVNLNNGATIREIPLSTLNLGGKALPISGGGYLRLYPYAITELFVRRRNAQGLPAMVYFHPWELDVNQNRVKVGMLKSFQHYVNLDSTAWKLDRLLQKHAFTSIRENLETEPMQALLALNPVEARSAFAQPYPNENVGSISTSSEVIFS